jgi:hypothetical protein
MSTHEKICSEMNSEWMPVNAEEVARVMWLRVRVTMKFSATILASSLMDIPEVDPLRMT